jgi:hypothetical protein
MKQTPVLLLGILVMVMSCQNAATYKVRNNTKEDLTDLAYVISRSDVKKIVTDTTKRFIVAKDEAGKWLPSQCDDLNGDGRWDELAFLCDLKAGEIKKVVFVATDSMPIFPIRTNIRFGRMTKPFEEVTGDLRVKTNDTKYTAPVYQMEGPAWENDMIAFRNYYDARNGIDIFGKRVPEMVMDSVGVNGRVYHDLDTWGMDILKVGNSLGAGAIAIGIGDSVYRVGPCEEGRYRLITEGPVRAMLELTYKNVPAGDRMYNIRHCISIYAGDCFYRSQVWIENPKGDEALVTGIVNLHELPVDTLSQDGLKIMSTIGNQGISGEVLGLGLIYPQGEFKRYGEAPATGSGVVSTHLVSLVPVKDAPVTYCFLAAWETRDGRVKDKNYFTGLLKTAANKINAEK